MRFSIAALLIALSALFAQAAYPLPVSSQDGVVYSNGDVIARDTVWEGKVSVKGVVFVPEGVTLTISPGTEVSFAKLKPAPSNILIPGSGLKVEGRIIAAGTREKMIRFTSGEPKPAPGDWGCIFMDHSKGSVFKRCRFEYSAYTIHAHFSTFSVSRCVITHNEDGSRIGYSKASYDYCDVTDNSGKGLNFYQCKNTVRHCNITGNQDGIFLNEKDSACVIEENNIHDNIGMDLRLGDSHAEDVALKGNWWGSASLADIRKHVYDKDSDPAIGAASIAPAPSVVIGAGVDGVSLSVKWKFKTCGYVDCSPVAADGVVYFGSWDKKFYAVKADTGEQIWSFKTGDCVDSSPAVADGKVYFGSWDRNIYCLDAKTGKLVWKFTMPPSNFDDHRQASPAVYKNVVYMGGFNGVLYALNAKTGDKVWEYKTGGPIRSRPSVPVLSRRVIVGSGDGFVYSIDASTGGLAWKFDAGDAVNTSPSRIDGGVWFGSRSGRLYHLDEATGKLRWSYDTGGRIEYSSPLLSSNSKKYYYVLTGNCNGTLQAVGAQLIWKFTGGGVIYSSPQFVGDKVVYGDNAGGVYCLDMKTGRPLGLFKAGDAVQGLSVGPDGVIYAGSRDGFLYALTVGE